MKSVFQSLANAVSSGGGSQPPQPPQQAADEGRNQAASGGPPLGGPPLFKRAAPGPAANASKSSSSAGPSWRTASQQTQRQYSTATTPIAADMSGNLMHFHASGQKPSAATTPAAGAMPQLSGGLYYEENSFVHPDPHRRSLGGASNASSRIFPGLLDNGDNNSVITQVVGAQGSQQQQARSSSSPPVPSPSKNRNLLEVPPSSTLTMERKSPMSRRSRTASPVGLGHGLGTFTLPSDSYVRILLLSSSLCQADATEIHFSHTLDSCFPVEKSFSFFSPNTPCCRIICDLDTSFPILPHYLLRRSDVCPPCLFLSTLVNTGRRTHVRPNFSQDA